MNKTTRPGSCAHKSLSEITRILDQRGDAHGKFSDLVNIYTDIWTKIDSNIGGSITDQERYVLQMITHKLTRILTNGASNMNKDTRLDSWLDIAGYALLMHSELEKMGIQGSKS